MQRPCNDHISIHSTIYSHRDSELILAASKLDNEKNGDETTSKKSLSKKVSFLGGAGNNDPDSPEPVSDTYIYQGDKEKSGIFSSLKRNKNK